MAHDGDVPIGRDCRVRGRARSGRLLSGGFTGAVLGAGVAALLVVLVGCSSGDEVSTDAGASPDVTVGTTGDREENGPATSDGTGLAVRATPSEDGRSVVVVVRDPAMPAGEGARQCALVRIAAAGAAPVAEGAACSADAEGTPLPGVTAEADGPLVAPLRATDGVEIAEACSVVPTPEGDPTVGAEPWATTFRFELPDGVPAGRYQVSVTATSGVGDGCAGDGESADAGWERVASSAADLSVS